MSGKLWSILACSLSVRLGAGAGHARAGDLAAPQQVNQDGDECLSALQVSKGTEQGKQRAHRALDTQRAQASHASAENSTGAASVRTPPPPPGAWNEIYNHWCNVLSYDPIPDLPYAKYTCACDEECGGVYYHSGQPWTNAAYGQWYTCKKEPLTCEGPILEPMTTQIVYGRGPAVNCTWWNGIPDGLSVGFYPSCDAGVPGYVWPYR